MISCTSSKVISQDILLVWYLAWSIGAKTTKNECILFKQHCIAKDVGKLFSNLPVRNKEFSRKIRKEYGKLISLLKPLAEKLRLDKTDKTEKESEEEKIAVVVSWNFCCAWKLYRLLWVLSQHQKLQSSVVDDDHDLLYLPPCRLSQKKGRMRTRWCWSLIQDSQLQTQKDNYIYSQ